MNSTASYRFEAVAQTAKASAAGLPALCGVGIALAVILPLLNFLRTEPLADFYGEWSSVLAVTLATFSILARAPKSATVNWSTVAIPIFIIGTAVLQVAFGRYSYAADWMLWAAYLTVALQVLMLAQVATTMSLRSEVASRLAWALVLTAICSFLLQVAQAARLDAEYAPFILARAAGNACQLFGNVGQTNHANTLSWLGIAGAIYLYSAKRVGARTTALLLAALLLSSALTVSRMGWLFLLTTVLILAIRQLWPQFDLRTRALLSISLIAGLAAATAASGLVRANIDASCVSAIGRMVDAQEGGIQVRLGLWKQAIDVWLSSPWIGVGAGGFIGSVYRADAGSGVQPLDAWAHNTLLQLLAEFGLIVVAAICVVAFMWMVKLVKHRAELRSEDGFFLAGLAILGIHSMLEFPLWFAHFLIIASLFLGLLIRPAWGSVGPALPVRPILGVLSLTIFVGCVAAVIDYRRLDRLQFYSEFVRGLGVERVPELQASLEEAAAEVKLFSQPRDYFLALGRPVTKDDLDSKIMVVERAMNRMPNANLIHLRILLAILDDDPATAREHLHRAFKFHPQRADAVTERLRARIKAQPDEFSVLDSILDEELARRPPKRW